MQGYYGPCSLRNLLPLYKKNILKIKIIPGGDDNGGSRDDGKGLGKLLKKLMLAAKVLAFMGSVGERQAR